MDMDMMTGGGLGLVLFWMQHLIYVFFLLVYNVYIFDVEFGVTVASSAII